MENCVFRGVRPCRKYQKIVSLRLALRKNSKFRSLIEVNYCGKNHLFSLQLKEATLEIIESGAAFLNFRNKNVTSPQMPARRLPKSFRRS